MSMVMSIHPGLAMTMTNTSRFLDFPLQLLDSRPSRPEMSRPSSGLLPKTENPLERRKTANTRNETAVVGCCRQKQQHQEIPSMQNQKPFTGSCFLGAPTWPACPWKLSDLSARCLRKQPLACGGSLCFALLSLLILGESWRQARGK